MAKSHDKIILFPRWNWEIVLIIKSHQISTIIKILLNNSGMMALNVFKCLEVIVHWYCRRIIRGKLPSSPILIHVIGYSKNKQMMICYTIPIIYWQYYFAWPLCLRRGVNSITSNLRHHLSLLIKKPYYFGR